MSKLRRRLIVCFPFPFSDRTSQSTSIPDPQVHLNFLTSLLSRIDTKQSQESHVLLLASIAHAKLLYGDLEGTKTDMDAALKILDSLENVDNGVNAEYYSVAADYYKVWMIPKVMVVFNSFSSLVEGRIRSLLQTFFTLSRMCRC